MSDHDVWQVRIVLRASEDELRQATDAIARALCPDEFHDGPCPTPWSMSTSRVDDMDDQDQATELRALLDNE
jgi:hypothetical protein